MAAINQTFIKAIGDPLFVKTFDADEILRNCEITSSALCHPKLKEGLTFAMREFEDHLYLGVTENLRSRLDLVFKSKYDDFYTFYKESILLLSHQNNDCWFELILKKNGNMVTSADSLGYYSVVPKVTNKDGRLSIEFGHDIYTFPGPSFNYFVTD